MDYKKEDNLNPKPSTDQNTDPALTFSVVKPGEAAAASKGFFVAAYHPLDAINTLTAISAEHFHSRFKGWIRAVAVAILMVFIPDQISWAFNYNPEVLWNKKSDVQAVSSEASLDEVSSYRIAQSVENLLKQIAYKEKTRIQLKIDDHSGLLKDAHNLTIDSDTVFTTNRIRSITQWLSDPQIHPLNCGVYALKDVLALQGIKSSLEEVAVLTLMVDLMSNIIKPGEPKLKTSLFAIHKVVDAFGLGLKAVKVQPQDALKLKTPFIANFTSEHFVTVTKVDAEKVYFNDIGRPASLSKKEFLSQMTGYVLASDVEQLGEGSYEVMSDAAKAFVWGSKWRDRSGDLPGLMSDSEIAMQIGIAVASAVVTWGLGSFGTTALVLASLGMAAGQFAQAVATVCMMEGVCSAKQGFILQVGLSAAISAGGSWASTAGSAANAAATGVQASTQTASTLGTIAQGIQTAWSALKTALTSISFATVKSAVTTILAVVKAAVNVIFSPLTSTLSATIGGVFKAVGIQSALSQGIGGFTSAVVVGGGIGVLKGYVSLAITEAIQGAICPDPNECSDTDKILSETASAVASSVAGHLTSAVTISLLDNSLGTNFGQLYGMGKTKGQMAREEGWKAAGMTTADGQQLQGPLTTEQQASYDQAYNTVLDGGSPHQYIASSIGDSLGEALKSEIPGILTQFGAMGLRMIAVQFGVKADSDLSLGIGMAANAAAAAGFQKLVAGESLFQGKGEGAVTKFFNSTGGRAMLKGLMSAGIAMGLSTLQEGYVGDTTNPRERARKIGEFRSMAFLISSLASGALLYGMGRIYSEYNSAGEGYVGTTQSADGKKVNKDSVGAFQQILRYSANNFASEAGGVTGLTYWNNVADHGDWYPGNPADVRHPRPQKLFILPR